MGNTRTDVEIIVLSDSETDKEVEDSEEEISILTLESVPTCVPCLTQTTTPPATQGCTPLTSQISTPRTSQLPRIEMIQPAATAPANLSGEEKQSSSKKRSSIHHPTVCQRKYSRVGLSRRVKVDHLHTNIRSVSKDAAKQ